MKITLFRILITVGLLWGGGQGLYTALFNLEPQTVTFGDYLKTKPDAKWLHITGGALDITGMSYSGSKLTKSIKEIYIPLVDAKAPAESAPVQVLVASKDPELLDLARQLRDAPNQMAMLKILAEKRDLFGERPITGLVRFGIDLTDKEVKKLRELSPELTPDFVIITDGEKPSFGLSLFLSAGGLLMLFFMLIGLTRKKPAPPAAEPPPMPAATPTTS